MSNGLHVCLENHVQCGAWEPAFDPMDARRSGGSNGATRRRVENSSTFEPSPSVGVTLRLTMSPLTNDGPMRRGPSHERGLHIVKTRPTRNQPLLSTPALSRRMLLDSQNFVLQQLTAGAHHNTHLLQESLAAQRDATCLHQLTAQQGSLRSTKCPTPRPQCPLQQERLLWTSSI